MNIKNLKENKQAQVLGLPMYLIIVMIIAVVVIAAVILMMPSGTKQLNAYAKDGFVIQVNTTSGNMAEISLTGANKSSVTIRVEDKKDGNGVNGAKVILTGNGYTGSGTTSGSGEVQIDLNVVLGDNDMEDYIKLEVTASGYEKFTDNEAIKVVRNFVST